MSPDASPPRVCVIIPALNEQQSIGRVLAAIPPWVAQVVVGDNGSTDHTAAIARQHGALVVAEPRRGYGSACLRALQHVERPDIVVFLDADFSDYPDEMALVIAPLVQGSADLVIGSRISGPDGRRVLPVHAYWGNRLSVLLMRLLYGVRYTDLGPFRAVRADALAQLRMSDPDYGWTAEMQVKAARLGLRVTEVPVRYRTRVGASKVSGTLRGSVRAGYRIIATVLRYAWLPVNRWPDRDLH